MFDISWSELLILGVVTLIFVGPKELPKFLGTLGRYAGVVRRQANEFRRIFDEAMREAELQELKKNVDDIRHDVTSSFRDVHNQTTTAMRHGRGDAAGTQDFRDQSSRGRRRGREAPG